MTISWPYHTVSAGILYGLSLLGVGYYSESEPNDNFPHLTQCGLIEQQILLRNPDSPGAMHYIIHAYDQPSTAFEAVDAADRYFNISTAVPHAIHMPSHIYVDIGRWRDSIDANLLAINTAYEYRQGLEFDNDWYHGSYFLQVYYSIF